MRHRIRLLLSLFIILSSSPILADSWLDPDWKEIVDSSDVIALVEFTTNGDFRAKAKPIRVYKGKNQHDEIWITNFSNRYGPIDTKKKGDVYLLFLNWNKPNDRSTGNFEKQVAENPDLKEFVEDYKSGKSYNVCSPTSGDLKVKGHKVQYDLLQSTYNRNQKYSSLKEFERFLKATQNPKNGFYNKVISKILKAPDDQMVSQYIMMLYLTNFTEYRPIFKTLANNGNSTTCYALAKLLGEISNAEARDILVGFLDHKNRVVQSEAVRQLTNENVDFIGPILLSKLKNASVEGVYSQNIMNPVMNSIDGAKIEIIKTIGKLNYKAAIPSLLQLLETDDEYLFSTTLDVLIKLGSKDYIPYLKKYLESGKRNFVLKICQVINSNELSECIPSLMHFVSNHDKSVHPSMEYTIDKYSGLAHFPTDSVKNFLYQDFLEVLKMKSATSTIDNKKYWIIKYMQVFKELKIDYVKDSLYNFMYDYYGINSEFKSKTSLFSEKSSQEDSISVQISRILKDYDIKSISTLVFLQNRNNASMISDYSSNIVFNKPIDIQKVYKLLEEKGINLRNVSLTYSNSTYSNGSKEILRFGDYFMDTFLEYISTFSDQLDIDFLENLKRYNFPKTDYEKKKLDDYVLLAKENYSKINLIEN